MTDISPGAGLFCVPFAALGCAAAPNFSRELAMDRTTSVGVSTAPRRRISTPGGTRVLMRLPFADVGAAPEATASAKVPTVEPEPKPQVAAAPAAAHAQRSAAERPAPAKIEGATASKTVSKIEAAPAKPQPQRVIELAPEANSDAPEKEEGIVADSEVTLASRFDLAIFKQLDVRWWMGAGAAVAVVLLAATFHSLREPTHSQRRPVDKPWREHEIPSLASEGGLAPSPTLPSPPVPPQQVEKRAPQPGPALTPNSGNGNLAGPSQPTKGARRDSHEGTPEGVHGVTPPLPNQTRSVPTREPVYEARRLDGPGARLQGTIAPPPLPETYPSADRNHVRF